MGHFPTPIHPFHPPGVPQGVHLLIKRDVSFTVKSSMIAFLNNDLTHTFLYIYIYMNEFNLKKGL
jgi:hypothetical protein